MCHTASAPWDEDRSDSGDILGGSAEESRLVALLAVSVAEHVCCEDDGNKLVASGDIQEESGAGSSADETEAVVSHADDDSGETLDHAACHHAGAETHGTDDKPNSVEHASHASSGNQVIQCGIPRVDGCGTVESDGKPLEQGHGRGKFIRVRNLVEDMRLEDECRDAPHDGRSKQRDDRRHSSCDEYTRNDWNEQCPQRNVESAVKSLHIFRHL